VLPATHEAQVTFAVELQAAAIDWPAVQVPHELQTVAFAALENVFAAQAVQLVSLVLLHCLAV